MFSTTATPIKQEKHATSLLNRQAQYRISQILYCHGWRSIDAYMEYPWDYLTQLTYQMEIGCELSLVLGVKMHNLDNVKFVNTLVLGYKIVYMPKHPFANGTGGWVYFHRLIMEAKIGRYIESNEIVHHIDGDKLNNDINNLELLSDQEHTLKHIKAKVSKNCILCGKEFIYNKLKNKYCSSECYHKSSEHIKWPTIEKLLEMLKESNYTQVAKKLGVSDNAIRKYLLKHRV